jgi:hypothetical protein
MELTSLCIRPRSRGWSRGFQPGFSSRIRPGLRFFPALLFSIGAQAAPIPSHLADEKQRIGRLSHRDEGENGAAIGSNHRPRPVITCSRRPLFRCRFLFGPFHPGPPTGPLGGNSHTGRGRLPHRSKGIHRPIGPQLFAKRLFENSHLLLDRAEDRLDLRSDSL